MPESKDQFQIQNQNQNQVNNVDVIGVGDIKGVDILKELNNSNVIVETDEDKESDVEIEAPKSEEPKPEEPKPEEPKPEEPKPEEPDPQNRNDSNDDIEITEGLNSSGYKRKKAYKQYSAKTRLIRAKKKYAVKR